MPIISGELTRSIKKCYPPGRHPDKSPLPSELSMLIFYLQTRPAKIQKAGIILAMRAHHYAAKDHIGNLLVTVEIVHEMVRKLNNHLNLFAVQALNVINIVTEKSMGPDGTFVEESSSLFQDFNKYHDGVLFSGHSSYAQEFLATTAKFSKVSRAKNPHSTVFALEALNSLGDSPALATRTGQQALQIAMHGLEANLPTSDPDLFDEDLDREPKHANTAREVARKALSGVRAFVDTTSLEQISRIITSLLEWLGTSEGEWQKKLIVNLAKWVPPQNRFIVTKTLVSEMTKLPVTDVKLERIYTTYLNALLRSDDSKIGLSVVDIQRQLMSLQHRLIVQTPESIDNQSIQDLIVQLRNNIASLAATNIYPGQVSDMISDILSKYAMSSQILSSLKSSPSSDNLPKVSSSSSGSGSDRPVGVILNDLYDIREILSAASRQQRISIDHWANTQWLLASQVPQVLTFYTLTFTDYVKASVQVEAPSSKRGSLIVRQLCQALLDPDTPKHPTNYIAIYYCTTAVIEHLGDRAHSALPWVYKVLPEKADLESDEKNLLNVSLMSVGLASLLAVARAASYDTPAEKVLEMITQCVKQKSWLPGIIYPTTVPVERSIGTAAKLELPDFEKLDYIHIDLKDLGFPEPDAESALHPDFELDVPLNQEDIRASKIRAQSLPDLINGSSVRNFSGRSLVSIDQSQAPKVVELRRRQTDTQSLRTVGLKNGASTPPRANHKGLPVKKPVQKPTPGVDGSSAKETTPTPQNGLAKPPSSTDLLSVLESVGLDSDSTKGRLTV